jgi:DNA-directed RNA polymerase specialized sigma24 family protein
MDDAAGVLTGVRNGDAQVFGDLYLAHARQVYSFCGRRTGNWTGAEDLTSIVFLEAWRTRERAFLVEGSLRAWLFGIAAHVISTSERSGRRHRAALRRFAGRRDLDPPDWLSGHQEVERRPGAPAEAKEVGTP